MKVEAKHPHASTVHPWISASCVFIGLGILALAVFWIRKCSSLNKKEEQDKALAVIGHERFYEPRTSRRGSKKRKRPPRRTHSAAEFPSATIALANKRAAFRKRSQSSEARDDDEKSTPPRVESLAKIFFGYRRQSTSGLPKHEYSALKTDSGNVEVEKLNAERQIRNGAFMSCKYHLEENKRYELKTQLEDIGSRSGKHWFIVQDNTLGAERLLSVIPLPSTSPLTPSLSTRDTLLELFQGLQHPYIHPVLEIEFWRSEVVVISPVNPAGSLKDLIYGASWFDQYDNKYQTRGDGLSVRTIQCLGRQIIEGLIFLRNRSFPPNYHLHSGNVIIQNGVARLAGLENALLGVCPKLPTPSDALSFGQLLFEMSMGYELAGPPTSAHLLLELEKEPKVAEALEFIFQSTRSPSLEELARCELFRGVELRELRGASIIQYNSTPEVLELLERVKNPVPHLPSRRYHFKNVYLLYYYKKTEKDHRRRNVCGAHISVRMCKLYNQMRPRKDVVVVIEDRRLEDIIEEDNEDSDCSIVDSSSVGR